MKIVVISTYPPRGSKHANIGGVASYTKNLVANFPKEAGNEITVLCHKVDGKFEIYEEDGLRIVRCFDKNIKCFFQLFGQIKKIKPDVIHIQQELALYGGILNAYLLQWFLFCLRQYRTVITLHGVVSLKKIDTKFIKENNANMPVWITKIAFYAIYRPLCLCASVVIVHEECFKKILVEEYGVKEGKIQVIHHGIEDLKPMSKEVACKKLGVNANKNIVLFMGYLTGYKGVELLIEGFSLYAKIDPNAFLIVGAGKHPKLRNDLVYLDEYLRLQTKAKELIPENQYKWVGFIDESDIVNYYSAADVSVYPYTIQMSSSGPMSIAIGYEKPFIGNDVFSGSIENRDLLFEGNKESLMGALNRFFNNETSFLDYIKKLKQGRTWYVIGNKTYYVYKKLVCKL